MSIESIIANFKELLKNNYYSQDKEEREFLSWLQKNTSYNNGVYKVHETYINYETEQEPILGSDTTLKNHVKKWARSRHEKQDYWNTLIDSHMTYLNGEYYCTGKNIIKQELTATASYSGYLSGKYVYFVQIKTDPHIINQKVGVRYGGTYREWTFAGTSLNLGLRLDEHYTSFNIHVYPFSDSENIYTGASADVTVK